MPSGPTICFQLSSKIATELCGINELDQLSLRLRGYSEVQISLMYNPVNVYHWINQKIHQKLPAEQFIKKTT